MNPSPKAGAAGETVSVKGKVLDAAGSPAANINVPIFVGSTKVAEPTTNADGVFSADLTSTTTGNVVYKFGSPEGFVQGEWTIKWLTPVQIESVVFDGHMPASAMISDTVELTGVVMADVSNAFTGDTVLDLYVNNTFHSPVLVEGGVFKQTLEPGDGSTGYHVVNSGESGAGNRGGFYLKWNDPAKMPSEVIVKPGSPTEATVGADVMVYLNVKGPTGQPLGDIYIEWFKDGESQGETYVYSDGTCDIRLWHGEEGTVVYTFGDPSLGDKQGRHTVTYSAAKDKVEYLPVTADVSHPVWELKAWVKCESADGSVRGKTVNIRNKADNSVAGTYTFNSDDPVAKVLVTNPAGSGNAFKGTFVVEFGTATAERDMEWTSAGTAAANAMCRMASFALYPGDVYRESGILTDGSNNVVPNARIGVYNKTTGIYYDGTDTKDEHGFYHIEIPAQDSGEHTFIIGTEGWNDEFTVTWDPSNSRVVSAVVEPEMTGQGNVGVAYTIKARLLDSNGDLVDFTEKDYGLSIVELESRKQNDSYGDVVNGILTFKEHAFEEGVTTFAFGPQYDRYLGEHKVTWGPALPNLVSVSKASSTKAIVANGTPASILVTLSDAGGEWLGYEQIEVYDAANMATPLETITTKEAGWGIYEASASTAGDVTYVFKNGEAEARHTVTWSDGAEPVVADFSPFYYDGKIRSGKKCRIRGKGVNQDYSPIDRKFDLWMFNKKTMKDINLSERVNRKGVFDFEEGDFVNGSNAISVGTEFSLRNFTVNSGAINPDIKEIIPDPTVPNTVKLNTPFNFRGKALDSSGNAVVVSQPQVVDVDFNGNSWTATITGAGVVNGTITLDSMGVHRANLVGSDNAYLGQVNFTVSDTYQLNSKPYGSTRAAVGSELKPALRLKDAGGTPQVGIAIQVNVINDVGETTYTTTVNSDANGDVKPTIPAQPEGKYTIRYNNGDFVVETLTEWTNAPVGSDLLSVPDTLSLDFANPAEITGKVVDQNGTVINARDLIVFNHDTNQMVPFNLVENTPEGFKLSVPPIAEGEHHLVVATENKRASVHTTWTKTTPVATTVEIDGGLALQGWVGEDLPIHGKVLDQYGEAWATGTPEVSMIADWGTVTDTLAIDGFDFVVPKRDHVDGTVVNLEIGLVAAGKTVNVTVTYKERPVLTSFGLNPFYTQTRVPGGPLTFYGRTLDQNGLAFKPGEELQLSLSLNGSSLHDIRTDTDGRWSVDSNLDTAGVSEYVIQHGGKDYDTIHTDRAANAHAIQLYHQTSFRFFASDGVRDITAFVSNADGVPVDGVDVELKLGEQVLATESTYGGEVNFYTASGSLPVVTEPTDYEMTISVVGDTVAAKVKVTVLPDSAKVGTAFGELNHPASIGLNKSFKITGTLVDDSNAIVTGAQFYLWETKYGAPVPFDLLKNDEEGFEIEVPYYEKGRFTLYLAADTATEAWSFQWKAK